MLKKIEKIRAAAKIPAVAEKYQTSRMRPTLKISLFAVYQPRTFSLGREFYFFTSCPKKDTILGKTIKSTSKKKNYQKQKQTKLMGRR